MNMIFRAAVYFATHLLVLYVLSDPGEFNPWDRDWWRVAIEDDSRPSPAPWPMFVVPFIIGLYVVALEIIFRFVRNIIFVPVTFLWREGIIIILLEMLWEAVLFLLLSPYYFVRFLAKRWVRRNHEAHVESHVPQPKPRQGPRLPFSPGSAVPPRGGRNDDEVAIAESSVQEPAKLADPPSTIPCVPANQEKKTVHSRPSTGPADSGVSGASAPYSEPGKHPAAASAAQPKDAEAQAVREGRKRAAAEGRTQVGRRPERKLKQETKPILAASEDCPRPLPEKEGNGTRNTSVEHAGLKGSPRSGPDGRYRDNPGAPFAAHEPKRPALSRPATAEGESESNVLDGPLQDDGLESLGVLSRPVPEELAEASVGRQKGATGQAPTSAPQPQKVEAPAVFEERKRDRAEGRIQGKRRQERKSDHESQPTLQAHENRPGSLPGKEKHRTRETHGEHARPEASRKSEPDIDYRARRGAALAEAEPKRPAISRPVFAERETGSGGLGGPSEDDELVFLGVFRADPPREVVGASASEPKGIVGKAQGVVTATAEMGAEKLAKREDEPPDTVVPVQEKMAKAPERADLAYEGTASDDEGKADGSSPDSGSTRARHKDVDLFSRM